MKSILVQIPNLIQLTLDKVSQVKSTSERPEVVEATKKLIKDMQGVTKELAFLSQKYAQDEPPKKIQQIPKLRPLSKQVPEQLSFDFMEIENVK